MYFFEIFSAKWLNYVLLIVIISIATPFYFNILEYEIPLIACLLIYLILIKKIEGKTEYLFLFLSALLLSVGSMIKSNILIMSILILIMSLLLFIIINNKIRLWVYLSFMYTATLVLFFNLAHQDISNLPIYFFNAFEISSAYNSGQQLVGPSWPVLIAVCVFIYILSLSIDKNRDLNIFILLILPLLLSAFKHSFVRNSWGYATWFFSISLIVFIFLSLFLNLKGSKNFKEIFFNRLFILLLLVLILAYNISAWNAFGIPPIPVLISKSSDYDLTIDLLSNKSLHDTLIESRRESIKAEYPLDNNVLKYIDNKSVDIFPWDVSAIYGYGLNWSPRPIFISANACNQYLDNKNSNKFKGNNSPRIILYTFKAYDEWNSVGRYILCEEPETFRSVLLNYNLNNISNEFIVLNRSNQKIIAPQLVDLGHSTAAFDNKIDVPRFNGLLFGYIHINYTIYGNVMNYIYKPSLVYIKFNLEGNLTSPKYVLIPSTAENGIFLSKFAANRDDLATIFKKKFVPNINSIVLEADDNNQFIKDIQIRFVGIPENISLNRFFDMDLPGWHGVECSDRGCARWIENNSSIIMYSDRNATENFSFRALSFGINRTLKISVNKMKIGSFNISQNNLTNESMEVHINSGRNVISLESLERCYKPCDFKELRNDDCRCLSIRFESLRIGNNELISGCYHKSRD